MTMLGVIPFSINKVERFGDRINTINRGVLHLLSVQQISNSRINFQSAINSRNHCTPAFSGDLIAQLTTYIQTYVIQSKVLRNNFIYEKVHRMKVFHNFKRDREFQGIMNYVSIRMLKYLILHSTHVCTYIHTSFTSSLVTTP